MEAFGGEPRSLSQSFRFGEAIAEVAREIAGVKVVGNPSVHSQVVSRSGPPEDGAAFVFRTNARLIVEAASYSGRYKVQVIGDTKELQDLVEAGLRLREGRPTKHPLLAYFKNYQDFLKAAELSPELKALRRLLENYRDPLGMLKAISRRGNGKPHYVFSTVHKAKGLEWDVVVVGDDFPDPEKAGPEEVNLRYVAATRAKRVLDLRW
jgi:superfamily I DNA/RNA helicase